MTTAQKAPWQRCTECDGFWCSTHATHVSDCPCPTDTEDPDFDRYADGQEHCPRAHEASADCGGHPYCDICATRRAQEHADGWREYHADRHDPEACDDY